MGPLVSALPTASTPSPRFGFDKPCLARTLMVLKRNIRFFRNGTSELTVRQCAQILLLMCRSWSADCLASTSYVRLAIDQPLCLKKLAIVGSKQPLLHESSVHKSSWLRCRSTSAACCDAEFLRGQSTIVRFVRIRYPTVATKS